MYVTCKAPFKILYIQAEIKEMWKNVDEMSDNFGITFDCSDYLKLFPYDHFIFFLIIPTI